MEKKILEILVEIQSDMRNLKKDVAELKTDVAELKADVADLKVGLQELSEREERHYAMLHNSIEDVIESVKYLDRKKMDRDDWKKII